MPAQQALCAHSQLQVDVSAHAAKARFVRPSLAKRLAAATPSGSIATRDDPTQNFISELDYTFPGPLLLPDDGLASGDDKAPQSLRSWLREPWRNPVTPQRKTLYLAPVPTIAPSASFMKTWATPSKPSCTAASKKTPPAKLADVLAYLQAFYHPLPVKLLPDAVSFNTTTTTNPTQKEPTPSYVGLQIGTTKSPTRIRLRACPDGAFSHQLQLKDVLDAALKTLPADAYAVVFATEQDLFEDAADAFCCGRAYGGSRVCVVSAARYHPALDDDDDGSVAAYRDPFSIEREHVWPASHCRDFVQGVLRGEGAVVDGGRRGAKRRKVQPAEVVDLTGSEPVVVVEATPLVAAVKAVCAARGGGRKKDLYGLWLSRVVRTVAHELAHCFCLGHCVYYACVMQGTGHIAEDGRQPPYLCPVCLKKVTTAIRDVHPELGEDQLVLERYALLREFCSRFPRAAMFVGFGAWLDKRMESLGRSDVL
ncbi:hypothetical protein B0T26DRAFT_854705 [Lasiosphaeria miniovina]|uniref:Archaemetzincin-2 n=1 Tax=Lasiosphaeria miniovina TaxID=1954250 RepID=A0AA40DYH1_9PEZI|nr:uncharacterized protein B0T26DRAFT_854705 [Lasiosphaeria miniovina]KAK0717636.1 hypothetical protein B0T26DRAFT_854705 [Lasiosphaeria miniovina]